MQIKALTQWNIVVSQIKCTASKLPVEPECPANASSNLPNIWCFLYNITKKSRKWKHCQRTTSQTNIVHIIGSTTPHLDHLGGSLNSLSPCAAVPIGCLYENLFASSFTSSSSPSICLHFLPLSHRKLLVVQGLPGMH